MYGEGVVGAGGAPGTGLNTHAARAPAATTPAPASSQPVAQPTTTTAAHAVPGLAATPGPTSAHGQEAATEHATTAHAEAPAATAAHDSAPAAVASDAGDAE